MNILLIYLASGIFFIYTFFVQTIGAKLIILLISFLLFKLGSNRFRLIDKRNDEAIKKETVELLQEFTHSQSTISTDYLSALLIDEASQTLFIAKREDTDTGFEIREYLFNEIYESSIEENNHQIALISRGGLLGGALLDGGGNSLVYVMGAENTVEKEEKDEKESEDQSQDKISKVSLKIVVDDLTNPIIEHVFLETDEPVDSDSDIYKNASKECKKWHQMISVLIKRHDLLNRVIINRYEDSNRAIKMN